MTKKQTEQKAAAVSGSLAMANHSADYLGNTPLIAKQTAVNGRLTAIGVLEIKQTTNIKGFAAAKLAAFTDMGGKAFDICVLLIDYAAETNNTVLAGEIGFTKADFEYGAQNAIKDRCVVVNARAVTNLADMITAGYVIGAPAVAALGSAIGLYAGLAGTPRAAIGDRKAATTGLVTEFKKLGVAEKGLFNLMVPYAGTNNPFYVAINDSYEVIDVNRKIAMRVIVTDSVLGVRLKGFDVKCVEVGKAKKSSERGIRDFGEDEMITGNYIIEVTRAGYKPFRLENIKVVKGKMTVVNALMVKL